MPEMDDTPQPTSLYIYYDEFGTVIYVGVTSRGTARQREHNARKEWWPLVARQSVTHYASRPEALLAENAAIAEHCPPFNLQNNPNAATHRANYEAFRRSAERKLGLRDELALSSRSLGVFMTALGDNAAEFVTDPRFPVLAEALGVGWTCPIHKPSGGLCGAVQSVVKSGPLLVLKASVRSDVGMAHGSLRLMTPPTPRRRSQSVIAKKIILEASY